MATRFTDSFLRTLKPGRTARKYRDPLDFRGFGLVVHPGGSKRFFFTCTQDGKEIYISLNRYTPSLSDGTPSNLAEQRDFARKLRALVDCGENPRLWMLAQKEQIAAEQRGTFGNLLDDYLAYLSAERAPDTYAAAKSMFAKNIRPYIDPSQPAKSVSSEMVRNAIARIHNRESHRVATLTLRYLKAAFNRALTAPNDAYRQDNSGRYYLERNPAAIVTSSVTENVGERALSFEEIRLLWKSLNSYDGMSVDMVAAIRLLLLTGQRVRMVIEASESEFDLDRAVWTIPASRMKAGKEHKVPLHKTAIDIVLAQKELHRRSSFLFPSFKDGNTPIKTASLSRAVSRYCERNDFEKFVPRDLRRTWTTRTAELKFSSDIQQRVQAHARNGDVSSKHYNRYDYMEEKREMLSAWGDYLNALVNDVEVIALGKWR